MPRKMPQGLVGTLGRRDVPLETHTTLQLSINTTALTRSYYFATAALNLFGIDWLPELRKGSQIRSSLTRSADQATVNLQNVDTVLGVEFLSIRQQLYGAEAKIGRYWKDLDSGFEFHKVLLTGVVIGLQTNEQFVTITAVSDAYANVSVGAARSVKALCGFTYKDPSTCASRSPLEDCNHMLNNSGGCDVRHGDPHKRAACGCFAYLNSGNRLKTV